MYVEGDVPVMQSGCNRNDGFGSDWGDLAALIVVAGIFGGFGNGGGLFGNNRGGAGAVDAAVQRGFDTQTIVSKLDSINTGLCDGFYAMNTGMLNGFGQVQQTLCQGFGGVNTALMQQGYETRSAINGVSAQLAQCCCDLSRGQERIACDIERSSNAIVQAGNANTQRILDFLCNEKISALQAENQTLKFAASQTAQNAFITANQEAQTAELIRRLGRDCPVPAYVVPNPNCCYGNPVGVNYGGNNCGCGNGCGCGC